MAVSLLILIKIPVPNSDGSNQQLSSVIFYFLVRIFENVRGLRLCLHLYDKMSGRRGQMHSLITTCL